MTRMFAKISLLITVLIAGSIISELLLQLFAQIDYSRIEYDPDFHHTLIKNMRQIKPFQGYSVNLITNSQGFRSREFPYAKPPNTRRVLVLGDSVTANVEVSDPHMFTSVLERNLNVNSSVTWEVINRGVETWSPDHEYFYLIKEGYKYKPDVVALELTVGNDISGVLESNATYVANDALVVRDRFEPVSLSRRINLFVNQNSALYNLVADFYRSYKNPVNEPQAFISDGYTTEFYQGLNETIALINAMHAFALSHNAVFLVVLYADPRQVNRESYQYWNQKNKNYLPFEDLQRPNTLLKEFFEEYDIPFLDTAPFINELTDYPTIEDGHLGIQGSKKLGDALAKKIRVTAGKLSLF